MELLVNMNKINLSEVVEIMHKINKCELCWQTTADFPKEQDNAFEFQLENTLTQNTVDVTVNPENRLLKLVYRYTHSGQKGISGDYQFIDRYRTLEHRTFSELGRLLQKTNYAFDASDVK